MAKHCPTCKDAPYIVGSVRDHHGRIIGLIMGACPTCKRDGSMRAEEKWQESEKH